MSWPLVQIGKYADKVRTWNPAAGEECIFQYVDLSSVDKSRKVIDLDNVAEISSAEAPSRARQLVVAGDVLVATVRPNLNGVAVVPAELNGATASTGYCVLRADEKNLHGRYLFHWVQTGSFVEDMMSKATGANYPAVSDKIVKESKIPLPPLPEQKRIAAILDKADAIRR
ncbi:TPA: restriction endonuclease subunit S [Pseudomonas aeruginosa]|nr:restriction endonuclease subunit S [Pseudomonas aeruginosa]